MPTIAHPSRASATPGVIKEITATRAVTSKIVCQARQDVTVGPAPPKSTDQHRTHPAWANRPKRAETTNLATGVSYVENLQESFEFSAIRSPWIIFIVFHFHRPHNAGFQSSRLQTICLLLSSIDLHNLLNQ
jgi:hypothetical protein